MENSKSVLTNAVVNAGTYLCATVAMYFTGAAAARSLGPEAIGLYLWCGYLISYASLITTLGLPSLGKKELALHPNLVRRIVSLIVSVQIIFAVPIYFVALFWSIVTAGHSAAQTIVLGIVGMQLLLVSFRGLWILQSQQRMVASSIFALGVELLLLLLVKMFIKSPGDIYLFAALSVTSALVSTVFDWFYLHAVGVVSIRDLNFSTRGALAALKRSTPIALSIGAVLIYNNMDAIMIGIMLGKEAVGQYSTAYALIMLVVSLALSIAAAFQPLMTQRYRKPVAGQSASRSLFLVLTWCGAVTTYAAMAWGREIFSLIYGPDFSQGEEYFLVLTPGIFIIFIGVAMSYPLIFWGYQKEQMYMTMAAALVNVMGNVLFLPIFGVYGAITTTLVCEFLVVILAFEFRRRKAIDHFPTLHIIGTAAVSCIFFVFVDQNMAPGRDSVILSLVAVASMCGLARATYARGRS